MREQFSGEAGYRMSNARSQLRNIIDSGRSIALDCYAIGRTIDDKDKIGRLFKTDVMNKTVVFKRFQAGGKRKDGPVTVDTTVYFPYDFDKVYDGGESVSLNEESFQRTLALKISHGAASKEMLKRIAQDLKILHLFESLHSLDPFIFRSKAEQTGIDKIVHPAYFAMSASEWQAIREPIREKIARLVSKALGGAKGIRSAAHRAAPTNGTSRLLEEVFNLRHGCSRITRWGTASVNLISEHNRPQASDKRTPVSLIRAINQRGSSSADLHSF